MTTLRPSRTVAFWSIAALLVLVLTAAGVPSPLLRASASAPVSSRLIVRMSRAALMSPHDRGGEFALGRQVGDVRPETELVEGRLVVAGGQAFSVPATGAR